jgi:hypothetical protein
MKKSAESVNRRRSTLFLGAAFLSVALSGCPVQPSYEPTITPVYAATDANGLYVYNGSSWTNYTASGGLASDSVNCVSVSGSGSGALVFAGTDAGVSYYNGASWSTWDTTDGLGGNTINDLFLYSNLYAATSGGVSVYNSDGSSTAWTNDGSVSPAKDVFRYGTYTLVVDGAGSTRV